MRTGSLAVGVTLVLVGLLAATPVISAVADELTYVVQTGDTLYSVSRRHGTSVAAIMQANGLANPNVIYIGQRLTIPAGAGMPPVSTPSGEEVTYGVRAGDTLYRISQHFGVALTAVAHANGIVNPSLIYVGQQLLIPGVAEPLSASPTPLSISTPQAGGGLYYTVQPGDTLIRIAARFGATVSVIAAANSIANPNLIAVGQQLWIPGEMTPEATPPPPAPPAPAAPAAGFAYGIQVHLPGQDAAMVLGAVNDLGFRWVKQQIEWKVFEPVQGHVQWAELDRFVDSADAHGLKLLFSVVKAPAWARPVSEEDGPPADYGDFWRFVEALARRYAGRVAAYEIWNEQNLRREWNGDTLSASRYVQLLAGAHRAIKAVDPGAIVVSGGLAPTGWNDGVTAIDDRVYLDAMYAAGLKSHCDAIGAHPNGWANSPTVRCCRQEPDVPSHNDHPSFFFRETLEVYWATMVRWGDSDARIWATEFGWGALEGLGGALQAGYEFVAYNTELEQASYLTQAFSLARASNTVGAMFVWNLNFCPVAGRDAEQCYWGIVRPDWSPRPAYPSLRDMPKP